jgi:hypothetical protein
MVTVVLLTTDYVVGNSSYVDTATINGNSVYQECITL